MNARGFVFLAGLLVMAFWGACESPAGPDRQSTGTVKFLSFEGGFYGIVADNGAEYDPLNLPAGFAVDGLRVRFEGKERPDKASLHMWGIVFEITKIERL
jgi:hypothetical protein